jgi:hypothetical protein
MARGISATDAAHSLAAGPILTGAGKADDHPSDLLAEAERPVNELVALTGAAQPQVSKHLRVLLTQCASREERDLIVGSGTEGGVQEQMEILEEIAGSLS